MSAKKKANPVKAEPRVQEVHAPVPPDIFSGLGKKAPFVALGVLALAAFIVFRDFILYDKVFLYKDIGSDSFNALYPYITTLTEIVHGGHLPSWSFNVGMGQNVLPYIFRDPFDVLFYVFGKNSILYGIGMKEVSKVILSGFFFYHYLKTVGLNAYTSIVGSLLFGFCSYLIIGSCWQVHSFEVFEMSLLLLGFELLFTKNNWYLFPVPLILICISQPFNLYLYGMFIAFYALLRLVQTQQLTVKNTMLLYAKMAGLGVLAILISAPILLENILIILESPRGSGTYAYTSTLSNAAAFASASSADIGTCILRFFSSDILGSGNNFKGTGNILEAPLFYCGISCLVLMPQVFQFLEKKTRIAFITFLSLWLMPVIFPYFRHAFFLFSGDYYRAYSFFVSFIFLYYTLLALNYIQEQRKVNLVTLTITVVLLLIFLNYPYFTDKEIVNSAITTFAGFMVVAYGAMAFFMGRANPSPYLKYVFLAAIFLETVYLSGTSINDRDILTTAELSEKVGYNDYSKEALSFIQKQDNGFYRIDKTYGSSPAMHMSLNDAMVQDYLGTSSYSSFNQVYYVNYLALMGIVNKTNEIESRWALGLSSRPILESENRVKYILAKTNVNPIWRITCDSLAKFGDVKVFRNKYVLPVGFTYSSYIRQSVFEKLTAVQKDFITLRACVIRDEDIQKFQGMTEFQLKDTLPASAFNSELYQQQVNELKKDSLSIDRFTENSLTGKIDVSGDKLLYISIPYDDGWKLKVDGQPQNKVIADAGMTGIMLRKGSHRVELSYSLRYFGTGMYLCALGLLLYAGMWFYFRKKNGEKAGNPG